jgi:hypothetical protein
VTCPSPSLPAFLSSYQLILTVSLYLTLSVSSLQRTSATRHEALDLGTETPGAAPAEPDADGLRAGNLWPDEKLLGGGKLAGFREDVMEY